MFQQLNPDSFQLTLCVSKLFYIALQFIQVSPDATHGVLNALKPGHDVVYRGSLVGKVVQRTFAFDGRGGRVGEGFVCSTETRGLISSWRMRDG